MREPTYELFLPLVGTTFSARHPDGDRTELHLERVRDLSETMQLPSHLRRPFALDLRAPESVEWHQAMLELEHAETGALSVFCVPIVDRTQKPGRLFEAVFA